MREVAGEPALLVDPDDVDAIAAALTRLHTDPVLRAELAARGRVWARSWTWERTAAATVAVYLEVLTAAGQGGDIAVAAPARFD